jgi:2-(1,2-epoxy-1,2-dihydrophenyl)acetyl-CoA isomerase
METLSYDDLLLEIDGPLATITLNAPDSLNALSYPMAGSFIEALDHLSGAGGRTRALLITGAGRAFCAGLDLKSSRDRDEDPRLTRMESTWSPLVHRLRDAPFPIVSAVNGPCAGIGVTIAIMADHVVAARSAYFMLPFIKNLALLGDAGITWILPRMIGWARARRMFLFSEKVSAETAVDWGLADVLCEDGEAARRGAEVARQLAAGPTRALAQLRKVLWEGWENDYERHLGHELERNRPLFESNDHREARRSFLEKRKPDFRGT